MNTFTIEITSVPDKDNLVAEIWYGEILFAEINQENEELQIEIYSSEVLNFSLDALCNILKAAKNKLLNKETGFQNE
jgi:hypothetical protein